MSFRTDKFEVPSGGAVNVVLATNGDQEVWVTCPPGSFIGGDEAEASSLKHPAPAQFHSRVTVTNNQDDALWLAFPQGEGPAFAYVITRNIGPA